jgi:ketosteroid isomerase-like protein
MPPSPPHSAGPPKPAKPADQADADASATARADARSVLAANQAFYEAFARGDLTVIETLWAHSAPVACIHPGWAALHGRDEVMESWRSILGGGSATSVRCTRPTAAVMGDSAYVVCGEHIQGAELVATNLFVREDGAWKLVHHHAGPVHRRAQEPRPRPRSGTLN